MKCRLIVFESKLPDWVETARDEYIHKLNPFVPFDCVRIKSPGQSRDDRDSKRRQERELLFKQLDDRDGLILFDEKGKTFATSELFAKEWAHVLAMGKSRVVLAIGGAYGFDPEVKARAQQTWSLSGLTMNHWLAQLVALEQIYRAFTLIKGIPYHNR